MLGTDGLRLPASRVLRTTHCPDALNKQLCLNYVSGWEWAHGTQMRLQACFWLLGGSISLRETVFLLEALAVPGSSGEERESKAWVAEGNTGRADRSLAREARDSQEA